MNGPIERQLQAASVKRPAAPLAHVSSSMSRNVLNNLGGGHGGYRFRCEAEFAMSCEESISVRLYGRTWASQSCS